MEPKKRLLLSLAVVTVLACSFLVTSVIKMVPAPMQVAQGADLVWESNFGGGGDDRAFYATKAECGYIVVGSSTSFCSSQTVAWVVRMDEDGRELWNRTYVQGDGAEFRYISVVGNDFLAVGNLFSVSGNVVGWVVKLDAEGNLVWNTTVQADFGVDKLFSAVLDGADLVVAGLSQPQNSSSQAWLSKLTQDGKIIWSKTFGGASDSAVRGVTVAQDGAYMASGYTDSTGNADYDFLILKISNDGKLIWSKTFGSTQSDKAHSIASEGNAFVVAGETRSKGRGDADAWIIKVDSDGNLLWDQTQGGTDFDSPTFVTALPSEGYVITGTTFSFGNGYRDIWLFKLDEGGQACWTSTIGREEYEEAYAVVYAGGNAYVIVGWTNSLGTGRYDFYVTKISIGAP